MRILVLTSTFPRWPGDREPPFVFELSRRLAVRHDVLVLAPHCRGAAVEERMAERLTVRRFRYAPECLESLAYEGGIPEKLRRARWRLLLVPCFVLAELLAAVRVVRRHRPHVIHAHWLVPQGIVALIAAAACRGKRPALVCTSHGSDLLALRGRLAEQLKRFVARRAAALTVVSSAMKSAAMRLGVPAENVCVMPMGVDARERFAPERARPRARSELLFVGRLVATKGVRHLLEALPLVREKLADARLTIVGGGPLEAELRAQAHALSVDGEVAFAGAVPNDGLPAYYQRAAVLVMPSIGHEGLGLVIGEALACECPVVASALPGVRELIEDGVTGLLAREGDVVDLADKIVQTLRDPARAARLAREGRARVLERLDWQNVSRRYEQLLAAAAG